MNQSATKPCITCGETKPLSDFYAGINQCKTCKREYVLAYQKANPEKVREIQRRWREANREAERERTHRNYEADREAALERARQYHETNREVILDRQRHHRETIRARVLAHYSPSSPPRCACPDCNVTENLTIDHVNGGGGEHRAELFGRDEAGWHFYAWLVAENFPRGYQVLCMPCNSSKFKGERCRLDHAERVH